MNEGYIKEIFFSYQGEGLHAAEPQVFIRFSGCNLSCKYCDTPASQKQLKTDSMDLDAVIRSVRKLSKKHRTKNISITGGEPLCQPGFLIKLVKRLKFLKYSIYLETNSTYPSILKKIIRYIDVISADIKTYSACNKHLLPIHKKFIKICLLNNKPVFIKLVITDKTTFAEIKNIIKMIKSLNAKIPLVIQPVTPVNEINLPEIKLFSGFVDYIRKKIYNVYIIPQLHKLLWNIK